MRSHIMKAWMTSAPLFLLAPACAISFDDFHSSGAGASETSSTAASGSGGAGGSGQASCEGVKSWRSVSPGVDHTCALTCSGEVYCWGDNDSGQLGTLAAGGPEPQRIDFDQQGHVEAISVSNGFGCAVLDEGGSPARSVWCWGIDEQGQLGHVGGQTHTPTQVGDLAARHVVAGEQNACAIVDQGKLICWGANDHGQSSPTSAAVVQPPNLPVSDSGGADLVDVAEVALAGRAESSHVGTTCILSSAGVVSCWGDDTSGQVGIGTSGPDVETPTPIDSPLARPFFARHISGSDATFAVVSESGQTYWWGDPSSIANDAMHTSEGVSASNDLVCILDGAVPYCRGFNDVGQLGQGHADPIEGWVKPGIADALDQIAVRSNHVCAITSGHELYCWGDNQHGQCGVDPSLATRVTSPSPIMVP